ncbi:serine/threonine protein kinase [Brunnivagina elsteri]|uniref:Serine/threonine protein kinase n=1 Tax=Brunnivagina elsteri CCALA 953 TaxID=987040 RepID=A0A2A2TFR5_9CYAN|nr:serine/threonine-protein kinase [Calothrix elsteri]PAX52572.1 serine/threonine protein kinase [Calothrix elsteri CCALA 953]
MNEQILQNRYEIKRQLGKKAGRRTLLAEDKITQTTVIIKLLTFSSDFAWEDLKLFEREAETLKTLNYQAIPSYVDYFELDAISKGYALVQSYVEGQSLEEHIKAGRIFAEKELKDIASQLLEILIYLHSQYPPVIHRDIKPSNIILVENEYEGIGKIYLVDFGSVQTLASKAGKTATVVGTYGYMPPEQFGGYATPASDLYSLGATLIALATGTHPADLPQQGMGIDFEKLVDLSSTFVGWLQWLTEPSVESRLSSATEALATLESGKIQLHQVDTEALSKPVNTWWLFGNALLRSTFVSGGIVMISAGLYGSIAIPVMGTIMGGMIGAMIGFPLGLGNGVLIGLITKLFFYPLKNATLHKRVLSMTSTILGTAVAITYFTSLGLGGIGMGSSTDLKNFLFIAIAPSIITGLSMGAVSKSFAQWYEKESRASKYLE